MRVIVAVLLGIGLTIVASGVALSTVAAEESGQAMLADPLFRVQFSARADGNGSVRFTGYVYNDSGRAADGVHLRITEIDFSGYEVASYVKPILEAVPALGRTYFDVTVPDDGESYRVAVHSSK